MRNRWIPRSLVLAASLAASTAGAAPPPGSAPSPKATLEQARAKQAVAEYAEAAEGLELFVRLSPSAAEAPDALKDAVVLRLGLGQIEQAEKDVDLFIKDFGATKPAEAARASFALGAHMVEHEDHAGAQRLLSAWMTSFDKSAPLDLRVRAHTLLGQVHAKLNQGAKAEAEYAVARDLWRDPAAATQTLRTESGDDDRRLAAALTAVGEARFFFAEQKRKEADKIRFPEYQGKGTKDEILTHVRVKVAVWAQKKRAAIEEVERAYLKVVEIQPMPPPRWVIASASRVGQSWARFVAEFRASPVPREWKGHGAVPGTTMTYDDLRALYYGALDQASDPLKLRAKGAFKTCVDYSVKYQYSDDYARACARWLSRNYKSEYSPLAELLPRYGRFEAAAPLPAPVAER